MPFDNTRRFKLLALSTMKVALASASASIYAQVPSAPQAPTMAPTSAPTAPQVPSRSTQSVDASKAKAPAAAASGVAPDGLTLKQLEKIEREMAVSKAKKALRDQSRADDEAGVSNGIPGANGGQGALRMITLPDGRRVPQVPGGPFGGNPPGFAAMPTSPEQQLSEYKVLSVVSFRGSTTADVLDASNLVRTVKVGDHVGPGTVASIASDGSVSVSVLAGALPAPKAVMANKREAKRAAMIKRQPGFGPNSQFPLATSATGGQMRLVMLARATDRVSGSPQSTSAGAHQPPRLDITQPTTGFMADATSVPMVGVPRLNGFNPQQFGPQGVPANMGGASFVAPSPMPGAYVPPAN